MARVLIIDDDADSRRAMAGLFASEDWNVLEAGDGEAGIQSALHNRPELILCDLLMPKSNGFQVCRTIREQLQPTKIIVVSGRDYAVDRTNALRSRRRRISAQADHVGTAHQCDRPTSSRNPAPPARENRRNWESAPARVKLWGVRGSIPVPGPSTVRYGGNTSCVEVRADGEIIILDAGSGIRLLGLALDKEFGARSMKLTLLITHTHWDHIQGLPFFSPAYNQKNLDSRFGL